MSSSPIPWKHVRNVLVLFAPLWCGTTLLFGTMGVGYALFKGDVYSASQSLVVRDEAGSSVTRLGRFPSQTELKAAQKTIQEMSHNREVVAAALRSIGPPSGKPDPDYPSTEVVDSIAGTCVSLLAPNGSEFGNTEVVYLQVQAKTQDRANKFCSAMYDSLTSQLRLVRQVRADSMIDELTQTREIARNNLDEASDRLRDIEIKFGTDLGELRNLNDAISGDGANRRALESITDELNAAELALDKRESLYELLVAGSEDPQQLLINGGELLAEQPSLLRLKEGLIDAQIASSRQSGVYTDANPKQRVALAAEKEINARMQIETAAVIRSMEPMLKLEREQVAQLHFRKAELSKRLNHLAKARTDYAKVDAEVRQRTEQHSRAERSLAEATAIRSAALSTNLVANLGDPQVSDYPVGPSGSTLTLGATMAGLICGLGAVFLIAPGPSNVGGGRRWSDYLQGGRRRNEPAVDKSADKKTPASE
jgi:succinoglycan biosynthesis transport protein ExoP